MAGVKISALNELVDPNDNDDYVPIVSVAGNETMRSKLCNLFRPNEYNNGTKTNSLVVNPSNGRIQKVTLTGGYTCALTFVQPTNGTVNIVLKVIQGSTPTGAISGGLWPGGTVPTITAVAGAIDIITIFLDGVHAYCMISQDFK